MARASDGERAKPKPAGKPAWMSTRRPRMASHAANSLGAITQSGEDIVHRLNLFAMIASGILILASVGSLAAKAVGLTKSSLFGDATTYVALGAIAVMGLAIWSDANRAEERAPGLRKKQASKEAAAARELPLWLSAWTKVVHYPTMLAGTTGIALLLGDSSWIEKHSHTEPWATKLAGLAVLATAAYVFVAARRITSKEPSDEDSKSTVSRKKHA